jgi:crotonobetainyl-CoA:carnitine CoA-transferase CaiB-like acyl-CoA transferase
MVHALEGLRVVDLSNGLAGVQASQLFADFGADVVHVEPPGGSPLRAQPAYPFWARGKSSVELNLRDHTDAAVARRLCVDADVVIETFRPGVVERLGLGYDALTADNPGVVYGSVTGFGRHGPLADLAGYEGVVMAKMGGFGQLAEMTDRPGPSFSSAPYATYPAAQLLAQGLLAALFERQRSGVGQRVDTSLIAGLSVHDTFNWFSRVVADRYPGSFSQTPLSVGGVPSGGLSFRLLIALTADGRWLQFSQTAERLFRAMMRAFELDWMFDDPRFASAPDFDDLDRRVEFWEILLDTVRAKTVAEWRQVFATHPDVWGEMFRTGAEALDHPQVRWNGTVVEIDDARLGPVRQPGPLAQVDGAPAGLTRSAPALGQHTDEPRLRPRPAASEPPRPTEARPPLDGVTCLELGTYYAAPFGTTLLAELGARVIKVEQLDGDPMRNMLPFPEIAGVKALQGKESVAVDVATEGGRQIVLELAKRADIVLQSFRAGVAERLRVDAAALRAVNPDLIYLTSPGYGEGGPCGRRPAYAPTIGAAAGLAWRNAGATIPERADLDLADVKSSALRLAYAVMGVGNADGYSAVTVGTVLTLGLLARERGAGAHVMHTSMLNSTAHALSETMVVYDGQPQPPTADGQLYGFGARYRLYEAADDWVFLAAPTARDLAALTKAMRPHSDLAAAADDEALAAALSSAFRTRPAAEWERDLRARGVACVVVAPGPVEAGYMDESGPGQLSGMVTEAFHPILDRHPRLAPLVRMSRSTGVAGGGCLVGQHTDTVLAELGYTPEQLADLRAADVIGS